VPRAWLWEKIRTDNVIITAIGGGDPVAGAAKVYSAGAAGLPGTADLVPPFIIVRSLPATTALPGADHLVAQMSYWVWVHDQQGSFEDVIEVVLGRLRSILPTRDPVKLVGGEIIMACRWEGDSGDQFDDGFGTATRYGQYTVVVRR